MRFPEVPFCPLEPAQEECFRQAGQGDGEGKAADESNVRLRGEPSSSVLMPPVPYGHLARYTATQGTHTGQGRQRGMS
jgi:hypothetical protein